MGTNIRSVATALPDHLVEPAIALAALRHFWPQLDRLIETKTDLGTRYLCEPLERQLQPRGLTELHDSYLKHAKRLVGQAAREALLAAGISGRDVDMLVTVSCTGYLVPSLDVYLVEELGLRCDVIRVPITELGCSAGASAIAIAHRHLLAFPEHRVLVMAVELPSLNFHAADHSVDNLTACLVFGDGAGAAVLDGSDNPGTGLTVLQTASHLVPRSSHLLGFDLRDGGFHVVLDRRLARLLAGELRPVVDRFMAACGLASFDFVAAHAGGPRIFDVLEETLTLPPDALDMSREVFTAIGNTSSAAIFFVLQRLIETPAETALQGLGLGLGPGVSIELMHLAWVPSKHSGYKAVAPREGVPVGRGSIEQHFLSPNSVN